MGEKFGEGFGVEIMQESMVRHAIGRAEAAEGALAKARDRIANLEHQLAEAEARMIELERTTYGWP